MATNEPIPAGVYLPIRAWRTSPGEVVLLAKVERRHFTFAFTPEKVLDPSSAGVNRFRPQGAIRPSTCFWPADPLEFLLNQMKEMGFPELPPEDFRIKSDGNAFVVIGKESSLRKET